MKPRKYLVRRKPMPRGKPLEQKTPLVRKTPMPRGDSQLKRTRIRSRGSVGDASPDGPTTKPNGPTKKRIESSDIPKAIRNAVLARDEFTCVRCGRYLVDTVRYGLQHRLPRKAGGSRRRHTMANLVTLCGWTVDRGSCTEAVELLDRRSAQAEGWLVPEGVVIPEEWPVRRWTPDGSRWMQPGEEWTDAAPHTRQLEMGAAA